jgi:hypothetical protein
MRQLDHDGKPRERFAHLGQAKNGGWGLFGRDGFLIWGFGYEKPTEAEVARAAVICELTME